MKDPGRIQGGYVCRFAKGDASEEGVSRQIFVGAIKGSSCMGINALRYANSCAFMGFVLVLSSVRVFQDIRTKRTRNADLFAILRAKMASASPRIPANAIMDLRNPKIQSISAKHDVIRRSLIVATELVSNLISVDVQKDTYSEKIAAYHNVIQPALTQSVPNRIPALV